ncbi:YfbM family protein [Plantactinospora siamensis]|uniref:YfbM family protein n=1 Tax=Plantactinospora siamensis TaxID=555372 RepID=A0ABV6P254_9ACTN
MPGIAPGTAAPRDAVELAAVLADPAEVDTLLYGDDDDEAAEPELDLDKSWHGIHYLLTGTAWEIGDGAGAAILGGEEVGEDNGYGPARLVRPDAVRTIAGALGAVDVQTLRARFDPQAMSAADIYPAIWANGVEELDSYLMPNLAELRRFYEAAASNGQAVLLALT